jgi:hypothetical protein
VSDQEEAPDSIDSAAKHSSASPKVIVLLVVLAIFGGVIAAKVMAPTPKPKAVGQSAGGALTSVHNDAAADYEAAIKQGKPIYVLFHSLS